MFSTLTSKGQLTVPKKVREYLGLKTGDKVHFVVNQTGKVELTPVKTPLTDLKGMLPAPDKEVSLEDIKKSIQLTM